MKSMVNENLGQICNAHVVQADCSPYGAADENCLKLAELAAQAVDFPKTGRSVTMPRELRPKLYPDFMEKPSHLTYTSDKIIGRLYRQMRSFLNDEEKDQWNLSKGDVGVTALPPYDEDLELVGGTKFLPSAWQAKCSYDARVNSLLAQYGVVHEEELVVGHVWSLPKSQDNRLERETKEKLKNSYSMLRREFRRFFEELGFVEEDEDKLGRIYELKASAWYQVVYRPDWVEKTRKTNGLSGGAINYRLGFPWIAADYLARIKVRRRRDRGEFDGKKIALEDTLAVYLIDKI